jgi:hypothetical protein
MDASFALTEICFEHVPHLSDGVALLDLPHLELAENLLLNQNPFLAPQTVVAQRSEADQPL